MPVYRLRMPTLGVLYKKGEHTPVTIPFNSRLTLVNGDVSGNGWVQVNWDDRQILVFAPDLRKRGERQIAARA